jgi:hypothetical protein
MPKELSNKDWKLINAVTKESDKVYQEALKELKEGAKR